jgi:murein L,D-transpeptidase YcbB/YkuD
MKNSNRSLHPEEPRSGVTKGEATDFQQTVGACLAAFSALALSSPAIAGEARWNGETAAALIQYADEIEERGLDPSAYETQQLATSIERGDDVAIELAASALFEQLARDISLGAVPVDQRRRWRIDGPAADDEAISKARDEALASGRVAAALDALAPAHAEYRALMTALANAPDGDRELKRRLAVNMERWRWMPRDLGPDYLIVNVPSSEAIIVRDGKEVARHRVIVGARKSPTPQFSASVTGVTINPTWFVPPSIVAESVGALLEKKPKEAARQGYYLAEDGGVRQRPGPENALGQMKLAMPNPYSVFIHDTPFRKNFDSDRRALSHGCIRVDDALGFAAEVLGESWSRDMLGELADTGSSVTIDLASPLPVYVAYFTAMTNGAGEVVGYADIYDLDETVFGVSVDASAVAMAPDLETCPAEVSG